MSGRLRPVPETAPRALALIRVSKEREGMVSPELQDTAIGDYCARRGYRITGRMEGLDESGSRARSRWWARLDSAIELVERGEVDVIVVWKFSRTARHRLRWAVALDRVETAGGRLESATEQVDTTTSTGRFTRGMLAELNAFEAERIGEQWKEAHARRLANGLPHSGGYRPGYTYEGKSYRPDPETAPIVVEAYERFAGGMGTRRLAEWLGAVGLPCRVRGASWTYRGAQRMLDSGWAAGLLRVHDPACGCRAPGSCSRRVYVAGAHEPIISTRLWEAYRAERARRTSTPRRLLSPSTPLSGLVRCGACGYGMRVKRGPRPGASALYACVHAGCPQPTTVVVWRAQEAALEWLAGYARDVERAASVAASERVARLSAKAAVTRLARAVNALDSELTKLTREFGRGVIPEGAYLAARDELMGERASAQAALDAAAGQVGPELPSRAAVAGLLDEWPTLSVGAKNAVLRGLLRVVVARGGRRSKVEAVPLWEYRPPGR